MHYLLFFHAKNISNSHCISIFGTPNATVHVPADSLNAQIFQFFFWSCYSTSLNLENIVATSNQFFSLKNYSSYCYINSLSPSDFFFSLILSISHINQTQHTKQNLILKKSWIRIGKYEKRERERERTSQSNPVSHIIQTQNKIQFLK